MTKNDILDAIGDIDPAYLEEAKRNPSRKMKWAGIGSLAACLLIFLIFPFGYQHYRMIYETPDYSAEEYVECRIYYLKDHALYYETVGVRGGDMEMFEIWKTKNSLSGESVLHSIDLSPAADADPDHYDTVFVTLSAAMANWFENDDGAWRLESLKKTIASYRSIKVDTIEVIFV